MLTTKEVADVLSITSRIREMVRDDQRVRFRFYRDGNLWYATESGFEFPVPTSDVSSATFLAEDRAMLFMRYIRKHLELLKRARDAGLKVTED